MFKKKFNIKVLLIALSFIILSSGCSLERKIMRTHNFIEDHPEVLNEYIDTVIRVEYDSVIYTDTFENFVYIKIPYISAEDSTRLWSYYDSTRTKPEYSTPWTMNADTIWASTDFSEAFSYVRNYKLYLEIEQQEVILKHTYDSIVLEKQYYEKLYMQELLKIPSVKIIPRWVYMVLGGLIISIILNTIFIIVLIRKKA